MPDVCALRTWFTRTVPLMEGAPVAGLLGAATTGAVSSLVSDSPLPASSVKVTRTAMARFRSSGVSVRLAPSAPSISLLQLIHW